MEKSANKRRLAPETGANRDFGELIADVCECIASINLRFDDALRTDLLDSN